MHPRAQSWISALGLEPHPERGYFRETYRSEHSVASPGGDNRAASTAIYFLIAAEEPCTSLHRLRSDEVLHLYEGGPVDVVELRPNGSHGVRRLGCNLECGERPQLVVESGTWFGMALRAGASHALLGCTVAPGFDFSDFELGESAQLTRRYPGAAQWIERLGGSTS